MPTWVRGILVGAVLDNIDEIGKYLKAEAQKTDNKADDIIVEVFVEGLRTLLTAFK